MENEQPKAFNEMKLVDELLKLNVNRNDYRVTNISKAIDYFMNHYNRKYFIRYSTIPEDEDTSYMEDDIDVFQLDVNREEMKQALKEHSGAFYSHGRRAYITLHNDILDSIEKEEKAACFSNLLSDFYNPYISPDYYKNLGSFYTTPLEIASSENHLINGLHFLDDDKIAAFSKLFDK